MLFTVGIWIVEAIKSPNGNKFESVLNLLDPKVKYLNNIVRNLRYTSKISVVCLFAII